MTLNVTVLTHDFAACVTDRRLSARRQVLSEQARKLIQIDTGPFKGLVAYNGIGRSTGGETPNDWLSEAQALGAATLHQFCDRLKTVSEPRIRALAPQFHNNPRHTFVLSGFELGTPVMGLVSNYESLGGPDNPRASDKLEVGFVTPRPEAPFGMIITGATHIIRRRSTDALVKILRQTASRQSILNQMTKVIRDTSFVDRLRGSVGSSVLSSVYDPILGFQPGANVIGGSTFHDMPDAYLQGMQVRDFRISGEISEQSRYDPALGRFAFDEAPCPNCGTPFPEGNRRCGGCGEQIN